MYFQITAQCIVFMLLHVPAANPGRNDAEALKTTVRIV